MKHIWGLFAARCAICREHLIEPGDKSASLVGEIAHIVGEKAGAARGKSTLTLEQRNEPDNLMLLCLKHHKIIDDDEITYTAEKLHEIRQAHLDWLKAQLSPATPWRVNITQYSYLNVPRLDEFALTAGFKVSRPAIPDDKTLRDFGFGLNAIMASYQRTLERIAVEAVAATEIPYAHDGYIGQLISFDRLIFRTKNMPVHRPNAGLTFTGDLQVDPHIYHQFAEWRLVININPRWTTTDTGYGMFRPSGGTSTFAGFARITQVDYETRTMLCTGLAIGLPAPNRLARTATGATDGVGDDQQSALAKLEDPVTTSRNTYWRSGLENCDLCGKLFASQTYMIDGAVSAGGMWACMCAQCYSERGGGLGIGQGQLFRKVSDGWLMVGGYPEPKGDEDHC